MSKPDEHQAGCAPPDSDHLEGLANILTEIAEAPFDETDLQMVERHVRVGKRNVTRQRELVFWLGERGYPTLEAERLLTIFEDVQRMHCEHLARLKAA